MWQVLSSRWTGTATGGSVNKLTDTALVDLASETFPTKAEGRQIRITSGLAAGDLRRVVRVDGATGDLTPNRPFSAAVQAGDTYELWGASIHGGQPLTDHFNRILRRRRPLTQTQLPIVTSQNIYDISSLVNDPSDVMEVYERLIDPAGLAPYHPEPILYFRPFTLPDPITGAATVKLEIAPSLTVSAQVELWVEHFKALPDFANDDSAVDAVYRDWLAYEAAHLHTVEMGDNSADFTRWKALASRLRPDVMALRGRFIPRAQRRSLHERPYL